MTDRDKLFELSVKKYNPIINHLCNRYHIDGYDKDDKLQEAYMVLSKCLDDFDSKKNVKFTTFLYTSIKNKMVDLIRKNKSKDVIYVDYNSPVLLEKLDIDEIVDNNDLVKDIIETLNALPRGYITYLVEFVGLTQRDVSVMEGISEQRVSQLNKRNIRMLRNKYNKIK